MPYLMSTNPRDELGQVKRLASAPISPYQYQQPTAPAPAPTIQPVGVTPAGAVSITTQVSPQYAVEPLKPIVQQPPPVPTTPVPSIVTTPTQITIRLPDEPTPAPVRRTRAETTLPWLQFGLAALIGIMALRRKR